jgi:PEP-CTERM motif
MKKLILPITLAIVVLALPAPSAHAQSQGCNPDIDANGICQPSTQVPEPGSFALVGAGLLALSGFVLLGRKKFGQANSR